MSNTTSSASSTPSILLHDTLRRKKVPFVLPIHPRTNASHKAQISSVLVYSCGPTVYGRAHIGNLSSYVFADILVRTLESAGYNVTHAKNITDVGHLTQDDIDQGEDKMVAAATSAHTTVHAIAQRYTDLYIQDEHALQLREPQHRPKASAYIPQQIAWIERLLASNHAYEIDGNVYFSIESFPDYGRLSGNSIEQLNAGARVETDMRKRHPADFLLWRKAAKDHVLQWDSPWGKGYPGWHIECSVMANETLGRKSIFIQAVKTTFFRIMNQRLLKRRVSPRSRFHVYGCIAAIFWLTMSKCRNRLATFTHSTTFANTALIRLIFVCLFLQATTAVKWIFHGTPCSKRVKMPQSLHARGAVSRILLIKHLLYKLRATRVALRSKHR